MSEGSEESYVKECFRIYHKKKETICSFDYDLYIGTDIIKCMYQY